MYCVNLIFILQLKSMYVDVGNENLNKKSMHIYIFVLGLMLLHKVLTSHQ